MVHNYSHQAGWHDSCEAETHRWVLTTLGAYVKGTDNREPLQPQKREKQLMGKLRKTGKKTKKEFLSAQELALLMGLSRQTIRNWIDQGDIRALQMGHQLKIPVHEVLRLLQHYGLPIPDWLKSWHARL